MKLVSFRADGGQVRAGAVHAGRVIDLTELIASLQFPAAHVEALAARGLEVPASGMLRLLYAGTEALAGVARQVEALAHDRSLQHCPLLSQTPLLAPVPRPGKIIGVGRNYPEHAKETGVGPLEKPRIFAKLPSTVVGPASVVKRPAAVAKLDFEAELAVVIGALASGVPRAQALDVVAGYTALNDLSAREFQFDVSPPQTTFAKSMDGFCPMGPWLVTKDEIADPQSLEIDCHVNGERKQHGHTGEMLFPVARLIEYLSQFLTLEPGDVIATGTPAGVGAFRKPPVWLKPGDRIRIEISRIGVLEHEIG
jgi:2-keto-4-pentenoate hydratase/2-oxohepta-3-ene-1,7-dioic acid hydratase in catechol pathway